jgi:hypothetical protein
MTSAATGAAPRHGDGPVIGSPVLRRRRRHGNVRPPWFRYLEPALIADVEFAVPPGGVEQDQRPIAAAFAASAALHALVGIIGVLAIGGGGGDRVLPALDGLRATLASPAQKFVAPEPLRDVVPPPAVPAPTAPASAMPKALASLPMPMAPAAKVKGSGEGRVILHVAEPDELPDPAVLGALREAHPGAMRVAPEFDVEPAGVYPEAALAARRQAVVAVVAVVHEDGRVELSPGTFDDPVFGTSIRDALAAAKARPPQVDGRPVTGWALLRFYYEFVGSGAAPAAAEPSR